MLVWNQVPSISVYKNPLHFSMLTTNLSKIKIKKEILFYSSIKKNKILGNKLNQGGKKKNKTLKIMTLVNEIEEDKNKWKVILFSWIERINMVKMSILPRAIYRSSATPIKIPILNFMWIHKDPK